MIIMVTAGSATTHRARIMLLHDVLHDFPVVGSIDILSNIFTYGLESWIFNTRLILVVVAPVNTII